MKKVFSNVAQVTHVWAQQSQEEGRNSTSSQWFKGTTLYSYSTPIANFVTNDKGERACLITTVTYSVTTSSNTPHSYDIHGAKVFNVKYIGVAGGRVFRLPEHYHHENVFELSVVYADLLNKATRARKNADYYLRHAADIKQTAIDYAAFFNVKANLNKFPEPSPDALEKIKEANKKEAAYQKREAAKKLKLQKAKNKESLDNWLSGESDSRSFSYDSPIVMRLVGDNVQTSRGAEFPIAHALKAFKAIERVKQSGIEWDTCMIRLGHFNITHIAANGDVTAGCHFVKWEAIAAVMKLIQTRG